MRSSTRSAQLPETICKQSFASNKRRCVEAPVSSKPPLPRASGSRSDATCPRPVKQQNCYASSTHRTHSTLAAVSKQAHMPACLQPFVTDASQWWSWQYNSKIHYRKKGSEGPAVLLIHGFGVGAFHFEQLLDQLSSSYQVWAIDLLGQGLSWPGTQPSRADGLSYSIDMWTRQLRDFIDEAIGQPVFLAGNSLGGLLSAHLAASQPHLCRGVVFLNATPFWSFMPHPETAPRLLTAILPWNGTLPAPRLVKLFVKTLWWTPLKTKRVLQYLVRTVYADKSAADDALVDQIMASTQHPQALDAFVSILFAPQSQLSFEQMIKAMQCPVCMVYGREDPWVVPLWGQRLKRLLADAVYLEVSPAGHCPHHEAPTAVHEAMTAWMQAVDKGTSMPWAVGDQWQHKHVTVTHVDGKPRNIFERLDVLWYALKRRVVGSWQIK